MKENIADFEKKREKILKQNYKLKAQISIYISNDGEIIEMNGIQRLLQKKYMIFWKKY